MWLTEKFPANPVPRTHDPPPLTPPLVGALATLDPVEWILDGLLPSYDFRSRYTRDIAASPAAVWRALNSVTAGELPLTRLLIRIRTGSRSRMSGSPPRPGLLADLGRDEGKEAVSGAVAKFWRPRPIPGPRETRDPGVFSTFAEPGWVKAAVSFQLTATAAGTRLAAETRVKANDAASKRLFAPYWLLIRLGGAGFIRIELLRAVAHRAEADHQ
jgi:hypothetical protein